MFSFASSHDHKQRRRILQSAYSKTAISADRVQNIIQVRTTKLLRFLDKAATTGSVHFDQGDSIILRNVFRALQADIFTAFAFSDDLGTSYLDNLREGANTTDDLGMNLMDLCHDEKRDPYFFWESELPFKYIARSMGRHSPDLHNNAHKWLKDLVSAFELRRSRLGNPSYAPNSATNLLSGTWERLSEWRHKDSGTQLDEDERLSEVLDHAGMSAPRDC